MVRLLGANSLVSLLNGRRVDTAERRRRLFDNVPGAPESHAISRARRELAPGVATKRDVTANIARTARLATFELGFHARKTFAKRASLVRRRFWIRVEELPLHALHAFDPRRQVLCR